MKTQLTLIMLVLTFSSVKAQTTVSGSIYSNSTWTKANSPYIVEGSVTVYPAATLTIEAGVEVRADSLCYLEFRGHLKAIGKANDSIVFTSNKVNPAADSWEGIKAYGGNLDMKYCVVKYAHVGLTAINTAIFSIKYCHFTLCTGGADFQGTSGLEDCRFSYNKVGLYNSSSVKRLHFVGNSYVGMISYGAELSESLFEFNNVGCTGAGKLSRSTFTNNHIAITDPFMSLRCNDIRNNDTGVVMINRNYHLDTILNRSNLVCSNHYNLVFDYSSDISLSGMCWCETDSASIAAKIIDGNDLGKGAKVNFMPFVNCSENTAIEMLCVKQNTGLGFISVSNLILYPNPAENNFILHSAAELHQAQINILDLQGRIRYSVSNLTGSDIPVSIDGLQAGTYFILLFEDTRLIGKEALIVSE